MKKMTFYLNYVCLFPPGRIPWPWPDDVCWGAVVAGKKDSPCRPAWGPGRVWPPAGGRVGENRVIWGEVAAGLAKDEGVTRPALLICKDCGTGAGFWRAGLLRPPKLCALRETSENAVWKLLWDGVKDCCVNGFEFGWNIFCWKADWGWLSETLFGCGWNWLKNDCWSNNPCCCSKRLCCDCCWTPFAPVCTWNCDCGGIPSWDWPLCGWNRGCDREETSTRPWPLGNPNWLICCCCCCVDWGWLLKNPGDTNLCEVWGMFWNCCGLKNVLAGCCCWEDCCTWNWRGNRCSSDSISLAPGIKVCKETSYYLKFTHNDRDCFSKAAFNVKLIFSKNYL